MRNTIKGVVDKCMTVWRNTLLQILSPLYSVDRTHFLNKIFNDPCDEYAPIDKYGKARVKEVATKQIKRHTWFTVLFTFFSVISQIHWLAIVFTILDFIQTQVVMFVLTEKLLYLYTLPTIDNDKLELFSPQKEVPFFKKIAISVSGFLVRQGLKYAARIVVVRVFLLNILKQIMKFAEHKAISNVELDGTVEVIVAIASAFIAGLVAWVLFYPMMTAYQRKLESKKE